MIWAAIATAIAIALGAGASAGSTKSFLLAWLDEWRKHLRRHVHDPERRAHAEAILDEEFAHLEAFFIATDIQMRALYDVHRDHAAQFDDYVPCIDAMLASFGELQHQQIAAFIEMHGTLTADEWRAIQEQVGKKIDKRLVKEVKAAAKAAKVKK